MGNTLKTSEKLQRKNSFLRRSNSTSIHEQEEHIYSTIDSDQVSEIGFDADEEEEAARWSLERRRIALRNAEITRQRFLDACKDLKENISTNVDALFKDLPDVRDPEFETKYKTIGQKLQRLFSNTSIQSKQKTQKK